jgi:hypothetical protein
MIHLLNIDAEVVSAAQAGPVEMMTGLIMNKVPTVWQDGTP